MLSGESFGLDPHMCLLCRLDNGKIIGNKVGSDGGAIYVPYDCSLTIIDSTLSGESFVNEILKCLLR